MGGAGPTGLRGEVQKLRDLVTQRLLSPNQAQTLWDARHENANRSVLQLIADLDFVAPDDMGPILACWHGFPYVDLADHVPDVAMASILPETVMRRYGAVPLSTTDDGKLRLALADPTNVIAVDDVRTISGMELEICVASAASISEILDRLRSLDRSAEAMLRDAIPVDEVAEEDLGIEDSTESAPIVRAINHIIAQGVTQRASDIHIEPQEGDVRIRYRIDGVLHETMRTPKALQNGLISRLKIMSNLDIAERRIPQDGRVSVSVEGKHIDLRVASIPSVWGEEIIMRILDNSSTVLGLEDLGFLPYALERYHRSFRKPFGAILVTGPTGSGKSTTLYATLNVLNDPAKKIITVEDPVEYRLPGLTQIQVNPKGGLTFARSLRSILRSDPDIVMVGEIRDRETAGIAVEAALTGHLVLSTLHTNDAPSAVTRLVEMGVEPFLVASALDCVLAQRLARRLCGRCREPYQPTAEALEANGISWSSKKLPTLYRPKGCPHCSGTGYRGRVALVEVMLVSEEIESMICERRPTEDIKRVALEQGMRTLREDGVEKILAGLTSVEEVFRVVDGTSGRPAPSETAQEAARGQLHVAPVVQQRREAIS